MKSKIGFFTTCIIILTLVPLRVYQYFNNIEIKTGFYKANDYTHFIFYGVLAIGIIASIVFFTKSKKTYQEIDFPKIDKPNVTMGVLTLVYGISFCIFVYQSVKEIFLFGDGNGTLVIMLFVVFSAISVICLAFISYKLFAGNGYPNAIACILPAILLLIRLIQTYISNFTIKNISEFAINILMINSILLFYLFFARIISGYKSKKFYSCAGVFASITAILCFASAGSRFVIQIINYNLITPENQPMYLDICSGIIAIVFLGFMTFSKKKEEETLEEDLQEEGFVPVASFEDIVRQEDLNTKINEADSL